MLKKALYIQAFQIPDDILLPSALVSVDSNQNALCTIVNLSDSEINIE